MPEKSPSKPYTHRKYEPYLSLQECIALILIALALCCLLLLIVGGCNEQDVETTVYKTLKVSAISYDAAMKSAADLYVDGYVSPEQMDVVIDVATKYRVSYLSCVSLLEAYHKIRAPTATDRELIQRAVTTCTGALAELLGIVTEYQSKRPPRGA